MMQSEAVKTIKNKNKNFALLSRDQCVALNFFSIHLTLDINEFFMRQVLAYIKIYLLMYISKIKMIE
jgi:hypothetical protein